MRAGLPTSSGPCSRADFITCTRIREDGRFESSSPPCPKQTLTCASSGKGCNSYKHQKPDCQSSAMRRLGANAEGFSRRKSRSRGSFSRGDHRTLHARGPKSGTRPYPTALGLRSGEGTHLRPTSQPLAAPTSEASSPPIQTNRKISLLGEAWTSRTVTSRPAMASTLEVGIHRPAAYRMQSGSRSAPTRDRQVPLQRRLGPAPQSAIPASISAKGVAPDHFTYVSVEWRLQRWVRTYRVLGELVA